MIKQAKFYSSLRSVSMTKLFRNLNFKKVFKIAFFVALLNLLNIECVVANIIDDINKSQGYNVKERCDLNDAKACETIVSICSGEFLYWSRSIESLNCTFEYSEKACNLNSADGCNTLGFFYLKTYPRHPKDPQKAQKYLQKGCDLGSILACNNLNAYF